MKLPAIAVVKSIVKRLIASCLIVGIAGLASVAGPAIATGASPPRARLKAFVCQHALDPAARAVSVTAVMRPLAGTRKMALRFQLLRTPGSRGPVSAVKGGDLGAWVSPATRTLGRQPDDVWVFNKQVVDLAAPAGYRFRVSFRWSGTRGRVLGSEVRVSQTCVQPELRPDLLVQSVKVQASAGGQAADLYTATIRNRGATAARQFQVQFSCCSTPTSPAVLKSLTVQHLAARASMQESFAGPPCTAGAPATITVDPTRQVDDYDRANNSLTVACPGPAGDRAGRSGSLRSVL